MAGFRLTLKRIARDYGLPLSGASYQALISKIIDDNRRRAAEAASRVSARRYSRALKPALDTGELILPAYATGAPTARKSAQSGAAITDTLRDRLTRSLRAAIQANPSDPAAAIESMQAAVTEAMAPYASRPSPSSPPPNVHAIAVTEVRSALDLSKWEYARGFAAANPGVTLRKRWRHNDHLVKVPRVSHRALDGVEMPMDGHFTLQTKAGPIRMLYPHDPSAPAGEVIGCQCSYDVLVSVPDSTVTKSLPAVTVEKARAPAPKVGDRVTRPDGTVWEKTGTYSYKKVSDGDGAQAAPKADAKPDPKAMTAEQADDVLRRVGKKSAFWNLTKDGLNNWLRARGEDPSKMSFADKRAKFDGLFDEWLKADRAKDIERNTIKHGAIKPYSNEGLKVEQALPGRYDEDIYNEVMLPKMIETWKKAPQKGGHWGSADSNNSTALAVAWSSARVYRPIDKVENGKLNELKKSITVDIAQKGVQLREYAQEQVKRFPREEHPSLFRGMTLDPKEWQDIVDGKSDTVELTGCTAFSFYEAIADRYSRSNWTKGFGENRMSVKIVLDRDDTVDESLGMWHHAFRGTDVPAFEVLSGLESVRVVKVKGAPKAINPEKRKEKVDKAWDSLTSTLKSKIDMNIAQMDQDIIYSKRMIENISKVNPTNPNISSYEARIKAILSEKAESIKELEALSGFTQSDRKFVEEIARTKQHKNVNRRSSFRYAMIDAFNKINSDGHRHDIDSRAVDLMGSSISGLLKMITKNMSDEAWEAMEQMSPRSLSFIVRRLMNDYSLDVLSKALVTPVSRVTLHCVPGRGKRSVTGGFEGSPDNVEKSYGGKYDNGRRKRA